MRFIWDSSEDEEEENVKGPDPVPAAGAADSFAEINNLMANLSSPSQASDSPKQLLEKVTKKTNLPQRRKGADLQKKPGDRCPLVKSKKDFTGSKSRSELQQIYTPFPSSGVKMVTTANSLLSRKRSTGNANNNAEEMGCSRFKNPKLRSFDDDNDEADERNEADAYSSNFDWSSNASSDKTSKDPIQSSEDLFRDIVFYYSGNLPSHIEKILRFHGATQSNSLSNDVTHFIMCPGYDSFKVQNAKMWHRDMKFVNPNWVIECFSQKKIFPALNPSEILNDNTIVSISSKSDDSFDPDRTVVIHPDHWSAEARATRNLSNKTLSAHRQDKSVKIRRMEYIKPGHFRRRSPLKELTSPRGWIQGISFNSLSETSDDADSDKIPIASPVKAKPGEVGLANLGNTCYMNASLQCLLNTLPLKDFFVRENRREIEESGASNINVVYYLQDIFNSYWQPKSKYLSLDAFAEIIYAAHEDFADMRQHDSQEFLTILFDLLNDSSSVDSPTKNVGQVVSENFQGILRSELECSHCRSISIQQDPIYSVQLPFPPLQTNNDAEACPYDKSSNSYTLHELFQSFITSEILSPLKCRNCEDTHPATKTLKFHTLPNYLIIHFKRFAFTRGSSSFKLCHKVKFPLNDDVVDLQAYVHPDFPSTTTSYRLYGCVCHSGSGVTSGHYTAYVKNLSTSEWQYFDDKNVRKEAPTDFVFRRAYILFYANTALD